MVAPAGQKKRQPSHKSHTAQPMPRWGKEQWHWLGPRPNVPRLSLSLCVSGKPETCQELLTRFLRKTAMQAQAGGYWQSFQLCASWAGEGF